MLSIQFFLRRLAPYVISARIPPGRDACHRNLELLDDQKELLSNRTYVGGTSSLPVLQSARFQHGGTIFIAGVTGDPPSVPLPSNWAVVFFSCSPARVYNLAAADVREAQQWAQDYRRLTDQGGGIQGSLRLAAQYAGSAAVLLDPHGSLIAYAGLRDGSRLLSGAPGERVLHPELMDRLFSPNAPLELHHRLPSPDGGELCAARAVWNGEAMGTLLIQDSGAPDGPDVLNLCCCTIEYLYRQLRSWDAGQLDPQASRFQSFWEDVMARRLVTRAEIRAAMARLPYPVQEFCRVVVVSFHSKNLNIPYNHLLSTLREFFPETNITLYQEHIVILCSHKEQIFHPFLLGLDQEVRLTALLKQYDGIMMIANGARHAEALATMYLLGKQTCSLAYFLRNSAEDRIFYVEDYIIYSLIDLCVQRYLENEHNEDILYLAHPAAILLTRYDREHNNNLRDVLFYFLLNDCSVAETATAMYMHRNTVNNKVNQIKKLIDLDLSDPRLRQRLLISCQILHYYERVMMKELL